MLGFAPGARAVPDRLLQVVPADPLAVVLLDRHGTRETEDNPVTAEHVATALLRHARSMGLFRAVDTTLGVVADVIAIHPELACYPRAIVLFDVQADPLSGGGFRLSGISAGMVVVTGKDHLRVGQAIQSMLNRYAKGDTACLTQRKANGTVIYTLVERRLPEWAPIEWGLVGDCYVITIGAGVFERLASAIGGQANSLDVEEWFVNAHRRCRGPRARWEWYIDFQMLCSRLAAVMGEKPRQVLGKLGLGDVSRGLWTVGPDCRAVDAACLLHAAGRDRYIPITVTGKPTCALDGVIPPESHSGAVIRARPREMIPRVCNACLAARSPSIQRGLTMRWGALESELGISAETDILAQLGPHVVIHDFPRHPLRLPLFQTLLIQIDGSADSVRRALDGLLARAQEWLDARADFVGLEQAEDGVWFVRLGLYGPALAVTERWVILSYSPQAVRENVRYLGAPSTTVTPQ